jgi:hypothetical protein
MVDRSHLHYLSADEAEAVAEEAERHGAAVLRLDTSGSGSLSEFFAGVRAHLPLDPPVTPPPQDHDVWDALAESLRQGIFQLGVRNVFLVWAGSSLLREQAPGDADIDAARRNSPGLLTEIPHLGVRGF